MFPASGILLEFKPRPTVIAIRKQHLTVEFIKVRGCFHRRKTRPGDRQQPLAKIPAFFKECRGSVRFSVLKGSFCFRIH